MKKLRYGLVTVLILAVTVRVLWWSLEPLLPLIIGGIIVLTFFGVIYGRLTRW